MKEKTEIQFIAEECINRWGGADSNTKDFDSKLEIFIDQLKNYKHIENILIELIKHFKYYKREKIISIFHFFHKKLTEEKKLKEELTIYCPIEGNNEKLNSSFTFLEEYRLENNISSNFGYRLDVISEEDLKHIDNLIFIDDIIGSGKTIIDFFKKNISKIKKVNIYILCIEIMYEGFNNLENFLKKQNIKYEILFHHKSKKAFLNNKIFSENSSENETHLREFEKMLWKGKNNFILGYNNSQALISFFRNTPNNTLSSFWFEGKKWQPLFSRNFKKPLFIKERSKINYNLKKASSTK